MKEEAKSQDIEKNNPKSEEVEGHLSGTAPQKIGSDTTVPRDGTDTTVPRDDA